MDKLVDKDGSYVYYKARKEWEDVIPIEQDKELPLPESEESIDVYNYMRGIIKIGEKSTRVLELTGDAIRLNPSNYSVWQYRRDTLQTLGIPHILSIDGISDEFERELQFSKAVIEHIKKPYHIWHHRKLLICWLANYNLGTKCMALECPVSKNNLLKQELVLTETLLRKDSRNYHAWQFRQWILTIFGSRFPPLWAKVPNFISPSILYRTGPFISNNFWSSIRPLFTIDSATRKERSFEDELCFVEKLIEDDVGNDSAWNQRNFVIKYSPKITISPTVVWSEIMFTWSQIMREPGIESPWSYLRGLFKMCDQVTLANDDDILESCKILMSTERGSSSVPLCLFMLSVYQDRLTANPGPGDACLAKMYNQSLEICSLLEEKLDQIGSSHWAFMRKRVIVLFSEKFKTDERGFATLEI